MTTRRTMIAGMGALGIAGMTGAARAFQAGGSIFDKLSADAGGRIGIAALDTGNGHRLVYHATERFALCSTFKVPLAAAVLWNAEQGRLALDKTVAFSSADLLDYAPVVKANLTEGSLTIEELAKAAVEVSDNAAANLLLPQIGGPRGLTRFISEQAGDSVTRLDRPEPLLNGVKRDDPRDTTTPEAIVELMRSLLLGTVLKAADREKLIGWMVASTTGTKRLRAGLPKDWRVGDKTGTGPNGEVNDIAIAYPPNRKPILIACYIAAPGLPAEKGDAIQQQVGDLIGRLFAR